MEQDKSGDGEDAEHEGGTSMACSIETCNPSKTVSFGEAKERRWASIHANWRKDFRQHSLATGRSESIGCSECKCGDCEGTECEGGNARA